MRLYPTAEQADALARHFGCVRFIYNWALAIRISTYTETGKTVSQFELQKRLPILKKSEGTLWLADVNAQSLQSAVRNLDSAYVRFFNKKNRFPKFKTKRDKQSFQCPQGCSVDFQSKMLSLPRVKKIKFRDARAFSGQIKTVTISKTETGKYFASILVEDGQPIPTAVPMSAGETLGLDLGLNHFATLSTGEKIANPKFLKLGIRRLVRAQRSLSRKKIGGSNREKCQRRVALIHERIANQRKDFQHKLSTRLIRENQAVALETLNVCGMQRNGRLARSIADAGWSQFVTMLEYKARWNGKTILRIGRFEPSSKLCSCGIINAELSLSDRVWTCIECGVTHDRDVLAASNIKRIALNTGKSLAQGMREFTPVETGKGWSLKQEFGESTTKTIDN